VVTDRLRGAAERSGQSVEAFLKSQAVDVPAGRLAEAEEIADVVAFLASERAYYVTGTALAVDGGLVRSI
jgi:NAD(P)-dependent dehydrogenase (short-subunit alcohol dehydrogenase family)